MGHGNEVGLAVKRACLPWPPLTSPHTDAHKPAAVPNRLEKIHWLVDLAVMSAMLFSLAKLRLKTLRVELLAMKARP